MISEGLVQSDEYKQLCQILDDEYGVSVDESDRSIVESKIRRYYERHGFQSLGECLAFIQSDKSRLQEIAELVYSPSTYFNRNARHFRFMAETLLARRTRNEMDATVTKVWCLGCSTGQEAYTAAIYLRELVFKDDETAKRFSVLGSDCSPSALKRAESGCYAKDDIERLRPLRYAGYFNEAEGGLSVVGPEIQAHVEFTYFNLTSSDYTPRAFDYIFLRNALDFHHLRSKLSILKNVRRALKPDAYLILGECPTLSADVVCTTGYNWLESGCYKVDEAAGREDEVSVVSPAHAI